jgi:hypothetical protein
VEKSALAVLVIGVLALFLSGATKATASEPHLFCRHTTTAYLVDGVTDYKPSKPKMSAPTFRYLYLEVEPVVGSKNKGTLTLNPSGRVGYCYYEGNKYGDLQWFSSSKEFL